MTQPGELDETLEQEDGQAEVEYLQITKEQYNADLARIAQEARTGAFQDAQKRMEGEINSSKDKRIDALQKGMDDIRTQFEQGTKRAEFEQSLAELDEPQQRSMRLLYEQSTQTSNPAMQETTISPPTQQATDNALLLQQEAANWGIQATWGDGNPIWEGLSTIPDSVQFVAKFRQNIQQVIRTKALEQAAGNTNGTPDSGNPSPKAPPAMAAQRGQSALNTPDAVREAFINNRIEKTDYEKRMSAFPSSAFT